MFDLEFKKIWVKSNQVTIHSSNTVLVKEIEICYFFVGNLYKSLHKCTPYGRCAYVGL